MSNILITGAAGFISSQLAYKLYKQGNNVFLLDNFSYGHDDNLIFDDKNFIDEIYRKDIRDVDFLDSLFKEKNFDIVYHLAGITPLPDCQNNPVEAVDVNVRGTVVLLDLARKYGVKKFIFTSTSAVYENNTDFPSVEEKVERPSLIYPSTKWAAEQFCKAYADAYGMAVVVLRFANVFGPHIDCLRTQPPVMGYIIRELFKGNSPVLHSTGEQERDFIYVDDLIDLVIKVATSETFDTVNVSTGKTITINRITEIIKEKMGCKNIETKYVDTSHYWDKYPELYEKPYPINSKLLDHEVLKYTCLSNKHAFEKYGWKPQVSIEEGIQRTVDFSIKVLEKANIKG